MEKRRKGLRGLLCSVVFVLCFVLGGTDAYAYSTDNHPNTEISPDGEVLTIKEKLENPLWTKEGTAVMTGVSYDPVEPGVGEHVYLYIRTGNVPVWKWICKWQEAQCIHADLSATNFHGLTYAKDNCRAAYYSGWWPVCATCGDYIKERNHYLTPETAAELQYYNVDYGYYYLCPTNFNLEQAMEVGEHLCTALSANKYHILYRANFPEFIGKEMEDSVHMYNNATEYEGETVTPITRLNKNTYVRTGYVFSGWNTQPDGSGTHFNDCQEIYNLTDENYDRLSGKGIIYLYAQWERSMSTLIIDAAGGKYEDSRGIYDAATGRTTFADILYGMNLTLDTDGKLTPPEGYTVSFVTGKDETFAPMTAPKKFKYWSKSDPFGGKLRGSTYYFLAPNGATDVLTANYANGSIVLPTPETPGFGGWFEDEGLSRPVGFGGDVYTPTSDKTLYASFDTELTLYADTDLTVDGGKGGVDLRWHQEASINKSYKIFQKQATEGEEGWRSLYSLDDLGEDKVREYNYTGTVNHYTVQSSGFYTLEAYGAQGGSYSPCVGGKGGGAGMKVWLTKGEVLTITVGGMDGYNGGGTATTYGNGGGATVISSDQKGILLIAGGGGGASSTSNGGWGGGIEGDGGGVEESGVTKFVTTGHGGEGPAGGGGGFAGGQASENTHVHTDSCYPTENVYAPQTFWDSAYYQKYSEDSDGEYSWEAKHYDEYDNREDGGWTYFLKSGGLSHYYLASDVKGTSIGFDDYFTVKPNSTLYFRAFASGWIENAYVEGITADGSTRMLLEDFTLFLQDRYKTSIVSQTINGYGWYDYDDEEEEYNRGYYRFSWEDGPFEGYALMYNSDSKFAHNVALLSPLTHLGDFASSQFNAANPLSGATQEYYTDTEEGYFKINIPSDIVGVRMGFTDARHGNGSWAYTYLLDLQYIYTSDVPTCGIKAWSAASGGSNYVNESYYINYMDIPGVREGDGYAMVTANNVGYLLDYALADVPAHDLAAPEAVDLKEVTIAPGGAGAVLVSWETPADRGTEYNHQAISYQAGKEEEICRSNITSNVITTGVDRYYYIYGSDEKVTVTKENKQGVILKEAGNNLRLLIASDEVKYLYLAPVDVAGNIGNTTAIKISATDIQWEIVTDQIAISPVVSGTDWGSVYHFCDKTYYVKADGETPFLLSFASAVNGIPSEAYQVDTQIFDVRLEDGTSQRLITELPHTDSTYSGTVQLPASQFIRSGEGDSILYDAMNLSASRKNYAAQVDFSQTFTALKKYNGRKVVVTPVAGASYRTEDSHEEIKYSDWLKDSNHAVSLIFDGEAPQINGLEILENRELINRNESEIVLQVTAEDSLSGVSDFYLQIFNTDNVTEKIYYPEADGRIRVDITADRQIFSGDFVVTAYAVDNVGNERTESYSTTEFALYASVERNVAPHTPIFQCGESGVLTITTYGYAERVEVEFPAEMSALNPDLNKTYYYTENRDYRQEEKIDFEIPLDTPANVNYTITVRAYKGDKKLEEHPCLSTVSVSGTIMDDFRTRLR